jgi:type II secretory pathway pseudopilin PulG
MSRTQPNQPAANGFAYLSLLIFLALMSFFCAMAVQVGSLVHRRAAEQALLDVGLEFARALSSYSDQTPAGMNDQPLSLQELLLDTRQTERFRHLRKIYPDPMTGSTEWGLEIDPDTRRIMGVFSLSTQKPIKVGNFQPGLETFNKKEFISEWVFSGDLVLSMARGKQDIVPKDSKLIDPRSLLESSERTSTKPMAPVKNAPISPLE